jgi:hypothetical protein
MENGSLFHGFSTAVSHLIVSKVDVYDSINQNLPPDRYQTTEEEMG